MSPHTDLQYIHPYHLPFRLTVIFLSRFMLDLRGIHFADRHPPGMPGAAESDTFNSGPAKSSMSDIRFDVTSRIVGNLGATLSYPDFSPRTSISSTRASMNQGHDAEIEEVERDQPGEWYGDEKPVYAEDPFKAGLLPRPPVVVDVIELQEPLTPLSPVSADVAAFV